MTSYIQVDGLTKSFGDLILFRNISFGITEGQHIGLIAKNGAGKTTLLNILAGKEDYDSGNVAYKKDLRIGYLDQDPQFPLNINVLEACFHSENDIVKLISKYENAINSGNHENLDELIVQMDHFKAWDYEQRAKQILSILKITNFNQKIEELSGGQLKRIALANVLITEPDLLILDEPTNHLDLEMTEWLEEYLNRSNISLLMVTHDRYFLDKVCSDIIEIDNRQIYQYKGNYSYYLEKRQERIDAQNADLERANNLFRKELEWMRRQPQARATKAKARIDSFHNLEEKIRQEKLSANVKLDVKASYIGNKIFEAKHIYKSFGNLKLVEDFNYIFARYEKMGIIGNNGTGKSTFIKMLIGEIQPDKGEFDVGDTINFGYYSQDGLNFNEGMKVIDVVQNIAEVIDLGGGNRLSASQFLQHFLFSPEKQHSFVHKLSGGEKRRLYLCTVLIKNPNFLVLDEPTNDLDIVTLNILEEYLLNFKGCIIIVSHDRYFMDKIVDHLLVFKGNADIENFPGGYTQYREWKELKALDEKEIIKQLQQSKEKVKEKIVERIKNQEKKKISFKEQREFESLNMEIPALEAEKYKIEQELSSGFLSSNELLEQSNQIKILIDKIEAKTLRWLELSEL